MTKTSHSTSDPNQDRFFSNIFIIDDEPVAGKVIELYLSQAGFQNLHVFTNSVEAMEILSIVNADLIITDVNMPELGGGFLSRLVRNYPHLKSTPVLIVSSDETEATRNQLLANGVFKILNKPVMQIELLDAVHSAFVMRERSVDPDTKREIEESETQKTKRIEKEQRLRSAFKRV
jgi:two-component system chemotaxis response regulator CheY